CNPYRIRNKSVSNVGLKTNNIRFEERSCLVYEVKPLPDQILDYVWDYGRLQPKDEQTYIQIMVQGSFGSSILAELLFASQEFIRNVEEPYSVSLRDVKRAIKLVKFFQETLETRQKENNIYPGDSPDIVTRSYILALGLCYMSRLYDRELRKRYRETMCQIFLRIEEYKNLNEPRFNEIIREEQIDYMTRMTCPPNTAFNEALLENVLAIIVCILCKVPLFIVGSPGSSKSLAIRLVHQNLRGFDSNDVFFRKLPQVFFIPHQGSSSSTSDGIEKVFQKAKAYQETSSNEFPVISVVLLDEVGLAETSPYNPLKVLHSLLEPSYPADGPTVSVVGISNWRLDNSKSSRALLVQRPKFDLEDLVETALKEADPPLLNRFEKQRMTMNDFLSKEDIELVSQLEEWTRQMSTMAGSIQSQHKFTRKDLFIGFNEEETLQ
ncbi:20165_t:CDS:2, partial [Funneliformis geosporum]